jgi:hypothetical protein
MTCRACTHATKRGFPCAVSVNSIVELAASEVAVYGF